MCPARSFHKRAKEHIPEALSQTLGPILEQIGSLTERIREYDRELEAIAKERYPETQLLRQVEGIGPLTALTFVLTLEDPHRFEKSRRALGPIWGWCQPPTNPEIGTPRGTSPRRARRC